MTNSIKSEEIEPIMGRIIGVMFARCEAAKGDYFKLDDACANFWWSVRSMMSLAIAIRGGLASDNSDCVHFSVVTGNELGRCRDYIASVMDEMKDDVGCLKSIEDFDIRFGWKDRHGNNR
jgi:hypothetical protein